MSIYALVDPEGRVYYVGKSKDPARRAKAHWSKLRRRPLRKRLLEWRTSWHDYDEWVRQADESRLKRWALLESTSSDRAGEREQWWYDRFVEIGANLANRRRPR
jgi:predicted GIY-YIG superfamily endonuclease